MEKQCRTYIVDTFTGERFAGIQAAVCLIPKALDEDFYQKISAEFNFSEVAFPVPLDGNFQTATRFELWWFTASGDVPLCCNATLATSHVLFHELGNSSPILRFATKSGEVFVRKRNNNYVEVDFPQYSIATIRFVGAPNPMAEFFSEFDAPSHLSGLIDGFIPSSVRIEAVAYASEAKNLIIVIDGQTTNFELSELYTTKQINKFKNLRSVVDFVGGVTITLAPVNAKNQGFVDKNGKPYDYVCRYFVPWADGTEDAASGSIHSALAPFWSAILRKGELYALQLFPKRTAQLHIHLHGSKRLYLLAQCVTVLQGDLILDY